ncbi:MAG: hypothetical protein QNJ77_04175 [Acidimicrobiia bacterium]|nr:hypothetical protein [Acidimicrobiia bacterium]
MIRLWRAAILALVASALVVGPAAAAFATTGSDGDGVNASNERMVDRPVDRVVDTAADVVVDRPTEREVDVRRDRVTDRVRDRVVDRPSDRITDRPTDRARDRQRPDCDHDRSDRLRDCRPTDQIRPRLARCIEYVQSHTDLVLRRNLRWWWHVCHRIAWNHNHPE